MLLRKKTLSKACIFLLICLIGFTVCKPKHESALQDEPADTDRMPSATRQESTPAVQGQVEAENFVALGDIDGYPAGCSPEEIVTLVLQFFDAYNAGNQAQLSRFFEPTLEFPVGESWGWFSDSLTGLGDNVQDIDFSSAMRDEVLTYMAERHKQHERFQLRSLSISGPDQFRGMTLYFAYVREADDYQGMRRAAGKGNVKCPAQTFFVWSSGAGPNDWEDDFSHINAGLSACPHSLVRSLVSVPVVCGHLDMERCEQLALCRAEEPDD